MSLSTTQYGYIVDPMVPFTDDKGKTIKNGFIRVFMAGTSTPVLTYRNYDGATNQEKIELDNSGRVKHNVIGSKGSLYKVVVYDAHHSQETPILTVDKIAVLGASINASGATIVTGLDSVTVQEENFLKATVEGTGVELTLDPTEVTSEVSTIGAAETAAPDYVVPLLDKIGTGDGKKISLANLFKFVLDWISRLATTVTSFASGDYFAVSNTTNGTRKMSKDTLLELTAQNALADNVAPAFEPDRDEAHKYLYGDPVIYGGALYVFNQDHYGPWVPSHAGKVNLTDNFISKLVQIIDFDDNDVIVVYDNDKKKIRRMPKDYLLRRASESAWQKDRPTFSIDTNNILFFYGENGAENNAVWFSYNGTLYVRGQYGGDAVSKSLTIAQLATELGVTLENCPNGSSNYIKLANGSSIVYNVNNKKFYVRANASAIVANDILVMLNRNAIICDGVLAPYWLYNLLRNRAKLKFVAQYYPCYIECTETQGGSIYLNVHNIFNSEPFSTYYTIAQLATALGVSLVTSPKGVENCLQINHRYSLVADTNGNVKLKQDTNVAAEDVVILSCMHGNVSNSLLDQSFQKRLDDDDVKITDLNGIAFEEPFAVTSTSFAENLELVDGDFETFLFFSDVHCYNNGSDAAIYNRRRGLFLKLLKSVYRANSVNKVLCGGDVLTSGDTPAEAIENLSHWFGLTKNFFKDFIIAKGNHETNERGTELLTLAQQNTALYADIGRAYYKKEMPFTDCYILDTGDADTTEMTDYRWAQLDWMANQVLTATKDHAIVLMHIYSATMSAESFVSQISAMALNLQTLLGAINSKTTVTLNGITYDFSGVSQKFSVILCGHCHVDALDDTRAVPAVSIASAIHSNTEFALDACVIDYAAAKLRCARLGGWGSDRTIDILV